MDDYNLKHQHIMLLLGVSYNTVKNWRSGTTFFSVAQENLLLKKLKEYLSDKVKYAEKELVGLPPKLLP